LSFLSTHVTDGTIEYIIATHQDADHIGGFTEVLDAYVVTHAVLYSTPASIATALRNTFEAAVTAEGSVIYYAYDLATAADPTISLADNVELEFINTNSLQTANANYSSIVFVLNAFGTRVLFNGDAEQNQEAVYAPLVGDVDIFKLGHHGT
jgi:beta-lactamase superfamily II metal-dependent hydrolase